MKPYPLALVAVLVAGCAGLPSVQSVLQAADRAQGAVTVPVEAAAQASGAVSAPSPSASPSVEPLVVPSPTPTPNDPAKPAPGQIFGPVATAPSAAPTADACHAEAKAQADAVSGPLPTGNSAAEQDLRDRLIANRNQFELDRYLKCIERMQAADAAELAALGQIAAANSQDALFAAINGAALVAQDGTYLGGFFNKYDSDSLFNAYGDYGSKYSSKSIWNPYGDYGSKYSDLSAWNPYASKPPIIIKNKQQIAYLTANPYKTPRVDPSQL